MKINKDGIEYDVEFTLPSELENNISINVYMNEWSDLFNKQELKKRREIRLKKLNRINKKREK